MSMQWFRFYHEVLDDPKVQNLPPEDFKFWVNLLCLACRRNGKIPNLNDIAFGLRMELNACRTVVERLSNAGLIDTLNGGANGYHYAVHSWDKRQYKSDTSTTRVKRFRERFRNVDVTASETPPDTDTEQIKKKPSKKENPPSSDRGSRLPPDWMPSEHLEWKTEIEKFRDYWTSQPGIKGVKTDWNATWRNWIRRTKEKNPMPVDRPSRIGHIPSRNFV